MMALSNNTNGDSGCRIADDTDGLEIVPAKVCHMQAWQCSALINGVKTQSH